jgi:hypothetical protein
MLRERGGDRLGSQHQQGSRALPPYPLPGSVPSGMVMALSPPSAGSINMKRLASEVWSEVPDIDGLRPKSRRRKGSLNAEAWSAEASDQSQFNCMEPIAMSYRIVPQPGCEVHPVAPAHQDMAMEEDASSVWQPQPRYHDMPTVVVTDTDMIPSSPVDDKQPPATPFPKSVLFSEKADLYPGMMRRFMNGW